MNIELIGGKEIVVKDYDVSDTTGITIHPNVERYLRARKMDGGWISLKLGIAHAQSKEPFSAAFALAKLKQSGWSTLEAYVAVGVCAQHKKYLMESVNDNRSIYFPFKGCRDNQLLRFSFCPDRQAAKVNSIERTSSFRSTDTIFLVSRPVDHAS